MRKLIVILILLSLLVSHAQGALFIDPPASDASPTLKVIRTSSDDEADSDQTVTEKNRYFIEIHNATRRFVGVRITRQLPSGSIGVINNGGNDQFIKAADEMSTLENISGSLATAARILYNRDISMTRDPFENDESRTYMLPVPDDLQPGQEVIYRVKIIGPALNQSVPQLFFYEPSPERTLLAEATVYSAVVVFITPMSKYFGLAGVRTGLFPDEATIEDLIGFVEKSPELFIQLHQNNPQAFFWDFLKFCINSERFQQQVKLWNNVPHSVEFSTFLMNSFADIRSLWNHPALAAMDWVFITGDWLRSAWVDEYKVTVVVPRIDAISPKVGRAGEEVTITGIGFDPYDEGKNNRVRFANKFKVPTVKGTIVAVPDENTLRVVVPVGFQPGPVEVCVDMLCSNRFIWDGFGAGVEITEPRDGAVLSAGVYAVAAHIADAPADFPKYPAIKRMYVDGGKVFDSEVRTADFSFTLDLESLGYGQHAVKVEVEFTGHPAVSDTITVYKKADLDFSKFTKARLFLGVTESKTVTHWDNSVTYEVGAYGNSEDLIGTISGSSFSGSSSKWGVNQTIHLDMSLINQPVSLISFEFHSDYSSSTGSSHRVVRGSAIPAPFVYPSQIRFTIEGKEACSHLSENSFEGHYTSGSVISTVLTASSCNANSNITIDLYAQP